MYRLNRERQLRNGLMESLLCGQVHSVRLECRRNWLKPFRIDKKNVRVIMPDTGSGYGGKHSGETAIEAARLAKEANKPVKVVWTREEEFTWAYFRPAE
jgi:CO/xanthine dehydrogenase Mo-binding subunit